MSETGNQTTETAIPGYGQMQASGAWRMIKDTRRQRFEMYPDATMLKLLGLDEDPGPEECFRHWVSRIEPEDLPVTEIMAKRMETTFDFNEVEYRWHHPKWGVIYVRCGGRMDKLENGVSYQSGYHQNITGFVRMAEEHALRSQQMEEISRQKKQYNDLFQSVICGIVQYWISRDGKVTFIKANREAIRIFGYSPQAFWEKDDWNIVDLVAPDDRGVIQIMMNDLQTNGDKSEFEYRLLKSDNTPCWIIGTAELLSSGQESNFVQSVFLDINDRKLAELENRKLRQEKEGVQEILRIALSGTGINEFFYYPKERSSSLPERLYSTYGFAPHYAKLPDSFADTCVYEADRQAYCAIYKRIEDGAQYASAEFRLLDAVTWLRLSMSVVQYDDARRPEYVVGIVEDITAQRQAENEKSKMEQLNKEVLHSLNELFFGVYRINITTGKVRAIRASRDMHTAVSMYQETQYQAESFAAFYHPLDQAHFISDMGLENLRTLYQNGQTAFMREYRRHLQNGYIWVSCTIYFKQTDQGVAAVMAITDITERHKMNDVIQALSDEYYAVYYLNLHTGQYETLRHNTRPSGWEAPWKGEFRKNIKEFLTFVVEEDRGRVESFFSSVLSGDLPAGKKVTQIFRERQKGGYEWTQGLLIGTGSNENRYVILAFRSVDQDVRQEIETKKLLKDALERAEMANHAKRDFLSRMSHDIRTPMNAILGMAHLAQAHKEEPEKLEGYFSKITVAGRHLMELINEVLDMSKIESGSLTLDNSPFDIKKLLDETIEINQNALLEKKQTFSADYAGLTHAAVTGDALRVQLVLNNILSNAIKYTPEGGDIRLTAKEITGSKQVSGYLITIEDNGVGMDEAFLKHIFEPFARAADSRTSQIHGTGLGMAIAYNLVCMMAGEIQVESRLGEGSRFTVQLPLKLQEDAAEPLPGQADCAACSDWPEKMLDGKRLLMAEDNELNMEIACALLEEKGAKIDMAMNGRQAVEKIAASAEGYYDLVLMDVQMPEMNGLDATRSIRALPRKDVKNMPIIAVTANAFVDDIKMSLAAGMNAHVAKPLDFNELNQVLSKLLK